MMMQKTKWMGLCLMVFLLSCSKNGSGDTNGNNNGDNDKGGGQESELIGKVLPNWQEGYLDIHAINTGRGESTLLIFPDGTTMLIDAAGSLISPNDAIPPPEQKPNSNVSPGTVIANYTKHFVKTASNKLNYMMVSHFHPDHMGSYSDPDHMGSYDKVSPLDPSGTFRMGGITEVGAKIAFDKIIDRGYPDYKFPVDLTGDLLIKNYIQFINWAKTAYGAQAEQLVVGKNDQIVLTQNPSKYANFEVRNICSNGVVWTGTGTESTNTLPEGSDEVVSSGGPENILSIGLVLSYGKFNYFTAGDIQYNGRTAHPWKDIEAPIAKVVPEVDVMKASHHGTANTNSAAIINSLKPQTVLIHPWRDVQPNPETISRFYAANSTCQIFSTNMTDANKSRLGINLNRMKSLHGHIVVRVSPGGDEYYVYVLDDNNEDYKVTGVFGPYQSK